MTTATPGTFRVYIDKASPNIYKSMNAVAAEVAKEAAAVGLDRKVMELVNLRVSQINGCPFCLDLHTRRALEAGDSQQRLAVLSVWREIDFFEPVERAALEIAECVTSVADRHMSDEEYAPLRRFLTDEQISVLIWAAITINTYNRVSIMSQHRVRRRD